MIWKWNWMFVVAALLAVIAVSGCGCGRNSKGGAFGYDNEGWTFEQRKEAKAILQVTTAADNSLPDITSTHITNVPYSLAVSKAMQAMNSYDNDKAAKIGIKWPISTIYEPSHFTKQLIDGHLYWVALMDFRSDNQYVYQQMGGVIPGVVVVDAEDERKPAQVRLYDNQGKPYHCVLHYRDVQWDNNYINRYIWNNGYPVSTHFGSPLIDDVTPELQDGTWKLYFTAAYTKCRFDNAGTYFMPEVEKILVIDPSTNDGKNIQAYDPDKAPAWVDRIYPPDIVRNYINAWGYNPENFNATSERGCMVLDENNVEEVLDKSGTVLEYVGIMTSKYHDNSALGVIIVPSRSLKARWFPLDGDMAMATPMHARQVLDAKVKRYGWHVEDLTLHNLYGTLSWEGTYVTEADFTENDSSGNNNGDTIKGSNYQGCVLLKADSDLQSAKAVWNERKQEAFDMYEHLLFKSSTSNVGSTALQSSDGEGTINTITTPFPEEETSVIFFTLKEPQYNGLTFRIQLDTSYERGSLDVVNTQKGDHVKFEYGDTKNSPTCFVRNFQNFTHPVWHAR